MLSMTYWNEQPLYRVLSVFLVVQVCLIASCSHVAFVLWFRHEQSIHSLVADTDWPVPVHKDPGGGVLWTGGETGYVFSFIYFILWAVFILYIFVFILYINIVHVYICLFLHYIVLAYFLTAEELNICILDAFFFFSFFNFKQKLCWHDTFQYLYYQSIYIFCHIVY